MEKKLNKLICASIIVAGSVMIGTIVSNYVKNISSANDVNCILETADLSSTNHNVIRKAKNEGHEVVLSYRFNNICTHRTSLNGFPGVHVSLNKTKLTSPNETFEVTITVDDEYKDLYQSLSYGLEASNSSEQKEYKWDMLQIGTNTITEARYSGYDKCTVVIYAQERDLTYSHIVQVKQYNKEKLDGPCSSLQGVHVSFENKIVAPNSTAKVFLSIDEEYKSLYTGVFYGSLEGERYTLHEGENIITTPGENYFNKEYEVVFSYGIDNTSTQLTQYVINTSAFDDITKDLTITGTNYYYLDTKIVDKREFYTTYAGKEVYFTMAFENKLIKINKLKAFDSNGNEITLNREIKYFDSYEKNRTTYSFTMPASDVRFEFEYEDYPLQLKYDLDGGICEGLPEYYHLAKPSEQDNFGLHLQLVPQKFIPIKEGYDFNGWEVVGYSINSTSVSKDSENKLVLNNYYLRYTNYIDLDANATRPEYVTIKANWVEASKSVTFKFGEGIDDVVLKVGYGQDIDKLIDEYTTIANEKYAENNKNLMVKKWTKFVNSSANNTSTMLYANMEIVAETEQRYFDVKFLLDGEVIDTKTYNKGDLIIYPSKPNKAPDNTYTYKFKCWDKNPTTVSENLFINAEFDTEYINYRVRFIVDGKVILEKKDYHYGEPIVSPEDPIKDTTKYASYKFIGWGKSIGNVSGNEDYIAVFNEIVTEYDIKFISDNKTIYSYKGNYNDQVKFPENPIKNSDKTFNYKFEKWDIDDTIVNGDLVYNAIFKEEFINYSVKFIVDDVVVLEKNDYHYGDSIDEPDSKLLVRDSSNEFTYTFSRWDKTVGTVTRDVEYYAEFSRELREYEVKFLNEGQLVTINTYHYEDRIKEPTANIKKEQDDVYYYVFTGWDDTVGLVKGNKVFNAVFEPIYRQYSVKFVIDDELILEKNDYHFNDEILLPENPIKEDDNKYTYTFLGWENLPNDGRVNGDLILTPLFRRNIISYTVKFIVDDEVILEKNDYHYGDLITFPTRPSKDSDEVYSYTFSGWDNTAQNVLGNMEFKGNFTKEYVKYHITWKNEDNNILKEEDVIYGTIPEFNGTPLKLDDKDYTYNFAGWDKEIVAVTGDQTYVATFTAEEKLFRISFYDENDNLIETITYKYGEKISAPSFDTFEINENKKFAGWVTEDGEDFEDSLGTKRSIKVVPLFKVQVTSLMNYIIGLGAASSFVLLLIILATVEYINRLYKIKKQQKEVNN